MGSCFMRISLELVPRSKESILDEVEKISKNLKKVNAINIPDLLRFDLRSWVACGYVKPLFENAIPHIRAVDINLDEPLPMAGFLIENRLKEIILISGDIPQDMSRKMYLSDVLDVIKKFKKEIPGIRIYAAFDPYRQGIHKELEYAHAKREAGADGFFTQPFFDIRLFDIYSELLQSYEVFWGVSPVLTMNSKNYWETRNKAVFPKNFSPTLSWNRDFAKTILERIASTDGNAYFMPIKAPILDCFEGIL
jgi:methylenetetrahydrofolate reductase (NADPH)